MRAWAAVAVVAVPLLACCSDNTEGPKADGVVVDAGPVDAPPLPDEGTADGPGRTRPLAATACRTSCPTTPRRAPQFWGRASAG